MSEAQLARIGTLGVLNEWPAIYFAKAFNAAIGEATAPPPPTSASSVASSCNPAPGHKHWRGENPHVGVRCGLILRVDRHPPALRPSAQTTSVRSARRSLAWRLTNSVSVSAAIAYVRKPLLPYHLPLRSPSPHPLPCMTDGRCGGPVGGKHGVPRPHQGRDLPEHWLRQVNEG